MFPYLFAKLSYVVPYGEFLVVARDQNCDLWLHDFRLLMFIDFIAVKVEHNETDIRNISIFA